LVWAAWLTIAKTGQGNLERESGGTLGVGVVTARTSGLRYRATMDQLVDAAIDAIANHLGHVGAQQAGRIADDAVDNLYRLVAGRLWQTPTGARVLGALQQHPAATAARQQARDVLHDEAQADAQFALVLDEAARMAGVTRTAASPGTIFGSISNRGTGNIAAQAGRDVAIAGRDLKIKKYHIGSIRFGTGGLVGGVALLLSLVGGGTAAVVAATTGPSVTVSQAVGSWQHGGSDITNGGVTIHEDPIVLSIAGNGDFDFNTALHMNAGGQALDQQYHCTGRAKAAGDHLDFAVTSGPCGNFAATLSGDGQTLSLSSFGQNTQPVSLTKSG
jgi:hypothetical protein